MDLLDIVFPKKCIGCGTNGMYLCGKCVNKVPFAKTVCPYCFKSSIDGVTHSKCQKKFGLDGLISVWEYDGVVKGAILATKYKYATLVGKELSEYFYYYLNQKVASMPRFDCLVPIPLYWYKQNVRGFNQSTEFGAFVSKKIGCKFLPDLMIRKKYTKSQALLNREKRLVNLKDAFEINSSKDLVGISSVLIIDDVFTTGATLKECAKVIKRHGIQKVWGLTLAMRSLFYR